MQTKMDQWETFNVYTGVSKRDITQNIKSVGPRGILGVPE